MQLPEREQRLWRQYKFIAVLLWLICTPAPASAAAGRSNPFIARSWSTDDGLPHNYILALTQTRDGYLWVGTRNGLARFDGVRFVAEEWNAVKNAGISCLCEGRNGCLWIALEGQGLLCRTSQDVRHYTVTNGLSSNFIRALREDREGTLWIGTRGGLTRCRAGQFQTFTKTNGLAGAFVEALCEDAAGTLWAGTSEGLTAFQSGVAIRTLTTADGLPGNSVTALCTDRHGDLWIGTSEGLAVRHADQVQRAYNEATGLPERFIRTLFEDHQGNLWIGAYGGLYRAEPDDSPQAPQPGHGACVAQANADGAAYDRVMGLIQDQERNLWVGSRDGLSRLRIRPFDNLGKQQGLSQNSVTSVCEDASGALWIATWRGGLNRLQAGRLSTFSTTNGLGTSLLLSLAPAHDGSLWIGADHAGGLYRYQRGVFTHFDARDGLTNVALQVLLEDRATNLWIGTTKTLTRFTDGKFSNFTPQDGLAGENVKAILEDHAGKLWIGTSSGLSCRQGNHFQNYTTRQGLSHNAITCLHEDARTNLWIGTAGGGLNRFREGKFTAYTTQHGLFSDELLEVLEDGSGCLWVSCPNGVFRIARKSLDAFDAGEIATLPCATFGKDEGVVGVQCTGAAKPAGWKDRSGRLWFTTIKGLAMTAPDIRSNDHPPPVWIEEVIADKHGIRSPTRRPSGPPNGERLRVPPGRGDLEIHYTACSFQAPDKNRFQYKLDGVDADWVDAGTRRVALYNHVTPGDHVFRVQACNNDGVWNERGATLTLTILPHYWQTWWFSCLAMAAAVGTVGGTAAYLTRRASRQRLARLERQHALEQERARIARDIHDDLGSSLTHIAMLSELAEADKAQPQQVEMHVRKIAASARETVRSLDEIVWAVSPIHDTWNSLLEYLSEYAAEFYEGTGVRCRLEMPVELPPCVLPSEIRHGLFLVIKEALNNSLKHARATEVRLRVTQSDGEVQILIADNGVGFPLEQVAAGGRSHGLQNMRERIHALCGRLQLESQPGQGTRVTIQVPLDATLQN